MKTINILAEEPPGLAQAFPDPASSVPQVVSTTVNIPNINAFRRERSAFVISKQSAEFRRRFYPEATAADWNDWRWQNRHRVRTLADLARMIEVSEEES